jgi:hypothetical protein
MAISKEDFTELVDELDGIRDELGAIKDLIEDVVRYPDDMQNPPRIMIEVRGPLK